MSIDSAISTAKSAVNGSYKALFLYGSYTRGDQVEESDIDVIQVTEHHTSPYSDGLVNVTCYTLPQLVTMARAGSLFIRHLAVEAIPLDDPENILGLVRDAYSPPSNYDTLIADIRLATRVVFVNEDEYLTAPLHFCATLSYLIRSYAYAHAAMRGSSSFSMRTIGTLIGDQRPYDAIQKLKRDRSYHGFAAALSTLAELLDVPVALRKESLEVVVFNSYGESDLTVVLALRILAQGALLTYTFEETTV